MGINIKVQVMTDLAMQNTERNLDKTTDKQEF